MRKTNLKYLTYLAITIGAFWAASSSAQPVTPIFSYTDQSWKYYQAGNQPANQGTLTWRTNTYNDTAWASGFGTFAYEPDGPGVYPTINTTLDRTNLAGQIITYYFRTHFNFPTNPVGAVLYFTNIVDDGMVVWLNGVETHRIRMPAGVPVYTTTATGTGTEGALELNIIVNPPSLRQGDNVIAVELHDTTGSSDVAWTCGLAYRIMTPITIIRHPPPQINAQVNQAVDLSVEVTGEAPRYWWFRNGTFVTNATNALLRFNSIQLTNAGTYHCVISNAISGARSSNCVVSVVVDTFPPVLLSGVINFDNDTNNRIYATFTEDMNRLPVRCTNFVCTTNFSMAATNVRNYSLREVATGREIQILNATPSIGLEAVRLGLGTNIDCSKEYLLTVSNLMDNNFNVMEPNPAYTILGCAYRSNLVDFQGVWDFRYSSEADKVPTNWFTTNFVDTIGDWGFGSSPFYNAAGCTNTCFGSIGNGCAPWGTAIDVGYRTYCFRTKFVVPTNFVTTGTLRLAHVIDDGAIFYLNGRELARYNMGTSLPVDHDYLAPCIEGGCMTNAFGLENLTIGTNVFAVELHDCGVFAAQDAIMGIQVDMIITNFPTRIPELRIRYARTPTRRAILDWDYRGWRLQTSTNVVGPWGNVAGVSTNALGYTNINITTDRYRFYRLCRP